MGAENQGEENRTYPIHIGNTTIRFDDPVQTAETIMIDAGTDEDKTDQKWLYALEGKNKPKDTQFEDSDTVNLSDENRKFFRIVPKGSGRS
ncbi:hypothetical protein NGM10_17515 (plasmid) [Halorussus salilacus]|uniref:hypothetical protein n=1 Tax=Halorussus salilacus TaxID=2953750 RepID=UPI00209F54D3|nr:hypothetical protein [Halorussus salilacus]USZ70125.1 hypothetical protein NGM10_17515 [Halorussus salilacus]